MKILILSSFGFQVAINNGNNVCPLNQIDLLVLQVSHMVLETGQQGSKLFDNLSAFRPCCFMNTFPILMGISAFSMRVAPIILFLISAPHFHLFLSARELNGANTVSYFLTRNPYMKFQNPSLNFFERTDGRKDTCTHGRTDKPKPICSPLFQSWGHNKQRVHRIKNSNVMTQNQFDNKKLQRT